ncbi:MAG: hypothetical protein CVV37_08490 [Nitrospira bacterium HGW-Nitrospira-1]|nr:MAG: hypothetical protein CVV37_08490 [Nitrospira bacterium HGW-Nitrospira-1]PKP55190.1 MAG: hypothetical protein CVT91_16310 [Candidatus Atribacteria bacterium HGW-Atribacteria-1]
MKKLIVSLAILSLFFGMAGTAMAAATDNHIVTVTVSAINELAITGGNITLTINTATAGSEPNSASDATTCDLLWTTNGINRKITVESDLTPIKFTLNVEATGVSGVGTAVPGGATFNTAYTANTPVDFITGISLTVGTCNLSYTASATAAQGTGSDVHTVTYTITAG